MITIKQANKLNKEYLDNVAKRKHLAAMITKIKAGGDAKIWVGNGTGSSLCVEASLSALCIEMYRTDENIERLSKELTELGFVIPES